MAQTIIFDETAALGSAPGGVQRALDKMTAALQDLGTAGSAARTVLDQLRDSLKKLADKVHNDTFKIMVVGTFKNGKSTFINSILGEDVLPAYSIPCTAVINEVKYGEEKRAILYFQDPLPDELPKSLPDRALAHIQKYGGKAVPPLEVPYHEIEKYVVIPMGQDPREMLLESPYEKLELFWPLDLLKNGVVIIDSPGLNEHATRTRVTMEYLNNADAILMVLNSTALCSDTEMQFIQTDLKGQGFEEPFFVANMFDRISKKEQPMVRQYAQTKLRDYTSFGNDGIYFVSALDALDGKVEQNSEKYDRSGMGPFEKQLSIFLTTRKGRIKLAQPAKELRRILSSEILDKAIPMQRKMLQDGVNEIRKRYEKAKPELQSSLAEHVLGAFGVGTSLFIRRACIVPGPGNPRPSLRGSSAAADGVGALKSATKSAIVKSVSWPTAEIIGSSESYIALATTSSLKGHKSSSEPPPLATIITSANFFSFIILIASDIFCAAPSPCTGTGNNFMYTFGFRLVETFIISLITAPVFDESTPIHFGIIGICFL